MEMDSLIMAKSENAQAPMDNNKSAGMDARAAEIPKRPQATDLLLKLELKTVDTSNSHDHES